MRGAKVSFPDRFSCMRLSSRPPSTPRPLPDRNSPPIRRETRKSLAADTALAASPILSPSPEESFSAQGRKFEREACLLETNCEHPSTNFPTV